MSSGKIVRIVIMGAPNSGKSTLIEAIKCVSRNTEIIQMEDALSRFKTLPSAEDLIKEVGNIFEVSEQREFVKRNKKGKELKNWQQNEIPRKRKRR